MPDSSRAPPSGHTQNSLTRPSFRPEGQHAAVSSLGRKICTCVRTSDGVHGHDAALHHVIQVEHLVPLASGDDHLAITAEASSVDGEGLQVDALDLWVRLPIDLHDHID